MMGPSDRNRLREIIRGRGSFEPIQCELWTTEFDAQVSLLPTPKLVAMAPRRVTLLVSSSASAASSWV